MSILKGVTISDLEHSGFGVARVEGKVVFVEDVLPGEIVDAKVTTDKKRYAYARPVDWHFRSPQRIEPFCGHFAHCGGCRWQYLSYADQVRYKEGFVREIFARIGRFSDAPVESALPSPTDRRYRNKMEYAFTTDRWLTDEEIDDQNPIEDRRALGLHVRGRYDRVLSIDECHLQPEPSNTIRNRLEAFARVADIPFFDPRTKQGFLRSLLVRTSLVDETMVALVLRHADSRLESRLAEFFKRELSQITSLYWMYNSSKNDSLVENEAILVYGPQTIRERCGSLTLHIHPRSFYQTNPLQAERLYQVVAEMADLSGKEIVYDLYSGIGSIGLFLSVSCRKVVGIEVVAEAVANARENASVNGVANCEFLTGEVEDMLQPELITRHGRPDVVIVDPPRSGLRPVVLKTLLSMKPDRIVYVSCNPTTQARDIDLMREGYELRRLRPVDMFPQTHHIETVALLVATT